MSEKRLSVALSAGSDWFDVVFDDHVRAEISALATIVEGNFTNTSDAGRVSFISTVDVLITGWGSRMISSEVLDDAIRLKAIFHTAGSLRDVVDQAAWAKNILVTNAADENARPVAEYTFSMIVLCLKRSFDLIRIYKQYRQDRDVLLKHVGEVGCSRSVVGIIGGSLVGQAVAGLLRHLDVQVLISDPYLKQQDVAPFNARLVPLDELFASSDVVTIHAPLNELTRNMIAEPQLALMKDGSTLINTGRGAIINQSALIAELCSKRLNAVLDVTVNEPLEKESPLWDLENVILTPHIAGSLGREVRRLALCAVEELRRFRSDEPPRHQVTKAMSLNIA